MLSARPMHALNRIQETFFAELTLELFGLFEMLKAVWAQTQDIVSWASGFLMAPSA